MSNTKYTAGFNGMMHRSASEAKASFVLACHGIFACEDYYPATFEDNVGNTFRARKDFHHAEFGIDVEYKCSVLNSLKNKTSADAATARFIAEQQRGFVTSRNYQSKLLASSWSDALPKQYAVQSQRPPASMLVVFESMPSEKEQLRIIKKKLFFCTLGNIGNFLAMYRLLHLGAIQSFSMCSHTFTLGFAEPQDQE